MKRVTFGALMVSAWMAGNTGQAAAQPVASPTPPSPVHASGAPPAASPEKAKIIDEPAPAPTTPATPAASQASAAPALSGPAATPTPPAPAAAPPATSGTTTLSAIMSAIPLRFYGTIRAMVDVTNGVETFGNPNSTAMTAAANPLFLAMPDSAYLSFQVQQTRAGVMVGEGTPVRGQVEIDFIHFDQASPTVQAFPRIRIAEASWNIVKTQKVFIGQNWDIYSPLNTHTSNLVGNLFQSGNAGFMRHQLGYSGQFGGFELTMALGFQGANAGPSFGNLEIDSVPTGSLRLAYRTAKSGWFGFSALGSAPRFVKGTDSERRAAYGVNAFADLNLGPLNLRAEVYYAQNLANLGTLTLAQGRFGMDVRDLGGYVSAKANLGKHALYFIGGAAVVLNPDDMVPGYTPGVATTMAPPVRVAALGPGIMWNSTLRAGYSITPWKSLTLVVEPLLYVTQHKLAQSDLDNGVDPKRMSPGVEFGALFVF